jgi:hypothetical protein
VVTSSNTAESWGIDRAREPHPQDPLQDMQDICPAHVQPRLQQGYYEYLGAKEHQDWDITAGEISRANRCYNDYDDEIERLRGQLQCLQSQLDD